MRCNWTARHLAGVKVAVVGDATAAALRERLALRPDLVPTRFVADSLAEALIAEQEIAGQRLLLLRADIARPTLPQRLQAAGANMTEVVTYHTQLADALSDEALTALREQRVNWVTFTSASTAKNIAQLLGDERDLLHHCHLASIGPITSEAVRELGLEVTVEAEESNIAGLVDAIVGAVDTRAR